MERQAKEQGSGAYLRNRTEALAIKAGAFLPLPQNYVSTEAGGRQDKRKV